MAFSIPHVELYDALRILHPTFSVAVIFPLIGIVSYFAWTTRQRRLQLKREEKKSGIPPIVGNEHLKLGRFLALGVVVTSLIGLLHPSVKYVLKNQLLEKEPFQVAILALLFAGTLAATILLFFTRQKMWLVVFGVTTALGVLLLGMQDWVFQRQGFGAIFRRDEAWLVSHFYLGMLVTLLMIFSMAIVPDIYKDRSQMWRNIHAIVNSFALVLFLSQGFTGARDLLEIPLGWQERFVFGCDYTNRTCDNLLQKAAWTDVLEKS
jgi:hypothetical protein